MNLLSPQGTHAKPTSSASSIGLFRVCIMRFRRRLVSDCRFIRVKPVPTLLPVLLRTPLFSWMWPNRCTFLHLQTSTADDGCETRRHALQVFQCSSAVRVTLEPSLEVAPNLPISRSKPSVEWLPGGSANPTSATNPKRISRKSYMDES